jgi:hypothetical protein
MATVFFRHQEVFLGGASKSSAAFSQCRVVMDLIRLRLGKLGSLFSALLRF